MKRLLLLVLITVMGVVKISAQELDLSQENSTDARIEKLSQEVIELSQKLEKLQEDYEYLALEKQIYDVIYKIKIFTNNVDIKANEIVVWCYNSSFDIDLYLLKENMYEKCKVYYDIYSQERDTISKQILNLSFSNEKQHLINILYDLLNTGFANLENSINAYRRYLDIYKKKGKGI